MATHSRGSGVKRVEVVWPEEFVTRLDEERGSTSRSAWLRQAAGVKLGERGRTVPVHVTADAINAVAGEPWATAPIEVKAENLRPNPLPEEPPPGFGISEKRSGDGDASRSVKTARQLLAERTAQMRSKS